MPSKLNVLVTGASTGIGRDAARRLQRAGHRVFGSVRKDADAAALRDEGIEPVIMDVTDIESVRRAATELEQTVGAEGLQGLVNNAGVAVGGGLEALPPNLYLGFAAAFGLAVGSFASLYSCPPHIL